MIFDATVKNSILKNLTFENKNILITGAGSGIGKVTAQLFSSLGAHVILIGRDEKKLQSTSDEIHKNNGKCTFYCTDLSIPSQVDLLFQQIQKLDVAVNNAGIEGKIAPIHTLNLSDFDEVMNINVRSLWYCMHHQVKFFLKNQQVGNIINISSIAGLKGIPNSSIYVSSKHAVLGLTKSVALEQIKNGIRVNAICPGPIETPMINRIIVKDKDKYESRLPTGRIGSPLEVAQAILWLASDQSSYVVGSSMVVDGGYLS